MRNPTINNVYIITNLYKFLEWSETTIPIKISN